MNATPPPQDIASALHLALLARGFDLPIRGALGAEGPVVEVDPLPCAVAMRLTNVLGGKATGATLGNPRRESGPPPPKPPVGTIVVDMRREQIARFQAAMGGRWWLRPVRGGCEWSAAPTDVRIAGPAERLRAEAARANARSRGEVL
ncbi:hypothetical protein AB0J21_09865 [Streptomyces sp. NPDC049954]|uniref:hypothetical protein n=1 Tax=Streptomyces sp. NPDC049954 TaxID=3155779 RepID=UPI0034157D17